jgi:hypothetical protein
VDHEYRPQGLKSIAPPARKGPNLGIKQRLRALVWSSA